ncbi:porin [Vibrio europaeus]|uniref:Porin n=1 Tax=Vibrio europaeus TaxID=300876 RepID=A0A178JB36_9VIBR|nr:porin [Vibrio europaeus]MDC5704120.1 porin [Vibrio europaeus]MDC5708099.1 porin [Vibrio europaeus]MDC5714612.1 porin [Vibrio europaeus]MDC5718492.1 porin [Vibrio europaeus]MDC5725197.1 porin [Vibrio europaeus]
MNKTLIALAVSAAAVATGANAAEIYNNDGNSIEMGGRVEARLAVKDGKAEDQSRVRLNFAGTSQINDNLYGLGFYEGEYKATKDNDTARDSLEHRYMYAGLGGNFGEVTMGTVKGSLAAVTDFTDIMAYHGAKAAVKVESADRPDRSIAYSGEFSGLELRANYTFESSKENNDKLVGDDNNGYALSTIYSIGDTGVRLTAAYAKQNGVNFKDSATNTNINADAGQYMLGASYEIGDFYVAGLYNDTKYDEVNTSNSAKVKGYELAAAYTLGQAKFTSTYNRADVKVSNQSEKAADSIAVDATYFFTNNFRSYVSYDFNLLKEDKVGKLASEDQAVLGVRYDF